MSQSEKWLTSQMLPWIIQLFTSNQSVASFMEPDVTDNLFVRLMNHDRGLPFVKDSDVPKHVVDWTTKKKLDERHVFHWFTEACSLFPINNNVDDDNEYGLVSKHSLNHVLRFLTKVSTIMLEGVMSEGHGWLRQYHLSPALRNLNKPQNPQELSLLFLCHLMKRPIVVLTDSINVGGIYLPSKRRVHSCSKHPIVVSYHMGQYSPLVARISQPSSSTSRVLLPLSSSSTTNRPIPLKTFTADDGQAAVTNYLNVVKEDNCDAVVVVISEEQQMSDECLNKVQRHIFTTTLNRRHPSSNVVDHNSNYKCDDGRNFTQCNTLTSGVLFLGGSENSGRK